MRGLLTALDGAFVPPGPAGAPARGRIGCTAHRAQSLQHRSTRRPDTYGLGNWPTHSRGIADSPRTGSRRMAATDRARHLGQFYDAHRRRRPGAGLRLVRRAAALGRRIQPGSGIRHIAAGSAGPPARRCDTANIRSFSRRFPRPDRFVRRCVLVQSRRWKRRRKTILWPPA